MIDSTTAIARTQTETGSSSERSDLFSNLTCQEDPAYLRSQLITYIGNKRKLLPLIRSALSASLHDKCSKALSFADVFAGTGVVSRMARQYFQSVHVNDFEQYSALTNSVYMMNRDDFPTETVSEWVKYINDLGYRRPVPGMITDLYSPKDEESITPDDRVFYTRSNAMFIDTARAAIEEAPSNIKNILLALLIQRSSVHVNTSGVFKGFYKNSKGIGQFGGTMRNATQRITSPILLEDPILSRFTVDATVTQKEAQSFVSSMPNVDIAYFDPPYNQHPYGSNYFMLNLIINNEIPSKISRVAGIPNDWQRSPYNVRSKAKAAFSTLIESTPARTLLISYNTEGFISVDDMMEIAEPVGEVEIFDQKYNTFRGCRNLRDRPKHTTEMVFKVDRR